MGGGDGKATPRYSTYFGQPQQTFIDCQPAQYARSAGSEWERWRAGDVVVAYLTKILAMTASGQPCFSAVKEVIPFWQEKIKEWEAEGEEAGAVAIDRQTLFSSLLQHELCD